ncbi:MAG: hypothetical protein HFJ79_10180 [Clostridiales bacterium]|nr:hypothetical protein [Clostridiales bacterium]
MTRESLQESCAARGFSVDVQGAVSGLLYGLPFRGAAGSAWSAGVVTRGAVPPVGGEEKVRDYLRGVYPDTDAAIRWERERLSVVLTPPDADREKPERFLDFLDETAGIASALLASPGESASPDSPAGRSLPAEERAALFRGAAGASLGALAGTLPWLVFLIFGGLSLGLLCFAMPVAAFFGYKWSRGPRSGKTAMLAAAIPSFVLLLPAAFFGDTLYWLRRLDEPAAFWQVLATPVVISQACAGALVGAALIVLGLIFLRNMVRDYAQGKPGKKKR